MAKTPAWQRKEGQSPSGGLNAKGRASAKAEGHNLKAPQPEGGSRKNSFCARMTGMKEKLTSKETANDPDSRINKSLRKWNCADGGAIWDKPRPKKLGKPDHLSGKEKKSAKAMAKAAGRPYPNLVDNMRAARAHGGAVEQAMEFVRRHRQEGGELEGDVQFMPEDKRFEDSGSLMARQEEPDRVALPMRPYEQRWNEATHEFNSPERKDIGFYGPVSVGPGDHVASEYSRDSDIGQYPTVAADMPEHLKVQALNAARFNAPVPEEADRFAYAKAAERMAQGRSPFYEPSKDPYPKWSPEQYWEKPAIMPELPKKEYAPFNVLPFKEDESGIHFDPNAGLLGTIKSAFTLPGDVVRGKVDPMSDEGFKRVQDLAGLAQTGSFGFTRPAGSLASGASRPTGEFAAAERAMEAVPAQPSYQRMLTDIGHYSPAAEAASTLKQEKGPASQMLASLRNLPGVKPEELKWSGVENAFQPNETVTRQQLVDYMHKNLPNVEETVRRKQSSYPYREADEWQEAIDTAERRRNFDEAERLQRAWEEYEGHGAPTGWEEYEGLGANQTPKFEQWSLPGGENYREVLMHLTTPNVSEQEARRILNAKPDAKLSQADIDYASRKVAQEYKSSHWDEPNVLGHLRMSDRTGPEGEKILHLEELQSDWGQAARKRGLHGELHPATETGRWQVIHNANNGQQIPYSFETPQEAEDWHNQLANMGLNAERPVREIIPGVAKSRTVPSAPYITNTQHWTDLGLKRALREAAEGGYDKMIWTPGAEQAARYDLSKHIDSIKYHPAVTSETTGKSYPGRLYAYKDGHIKINQEAKPEELEGLLGKDVAERLLKSSPEKTSMDLSPYHYISGEDLKVGGEGMQSFYDKIVPTQLSKLIKKLDPKAKIEMGGHTIDVGKGKPTQYRDFDEYAKSPQSRQINAHALRLTPELRKRILEGLPAYAKGGAVESAMNFVRKNKSYK